MELVKNVFIDEMTWASCKFGRRMVDRATIEAMGGTFNGDALIANVLNQSFNRTLGLDGTGDFLGFGDNTALNVGTGDRTIEAIVNTADTAGVIFGKRSGSGNGWMLETTTGPKAKFSIDDGTEATGNSSSNLPSGYVHILMSVDRSGNVTFYLQGVADGSFDISGSSGSLLNTITAYVGIDGDGSSNPLNANVPMVGMWDRTFTPAEALQRAAMFGFGSGFAPDLERGLISYWPLGNIQGTTVKDIVGSNNGTATSMSESNQVVGYNYQRGGLDFGSGDSIEIGTNFGLTDKVTISAWIKTTDAGGIIVSSPKNESAGQTGVFLSVTNSNLRLSVSNVSASNAFVGGSLSVDSSVWVHVAGVYNGADLRVYVNGKSDATPVTQTGNIDLTEDKTWIGIFGPSFSTGVNKFDGSIQDVMIYNRALSGLEIELLHNEQRTGRRI